MSYSYTDSHTAEGYGDRYTRTYSAGYYYYQWEKVEKALLVSELEKLRAEGKNTYLDFACGTGRILAVGERIFETSYGVDVAETMLEHARRNCHRSTILRRNITIDPLERTFEVVTAFRFFLNAEPELRSSVLKALHAHVTEDGVLVANIHTNSISPLGLAYRIRNKLTDLYTPTLSVREFRELLEAHGFAVEKVIMYGYLPRTGWALGWIPKYFLLPVEKVGRALSPLVGRFAQSFLVIARRK